MSADLSRMCPASRLLITRTCSPLWPWVLQKMNGHLIIKINCGLHYFLFYGRQQCTSKDRNIVAFTKMQLFDHLNKPFLRKKDNLMRLLMWLIRVGQDFALVYFPFLSHHQFSIMLATLWGCLSAALQFFKWNMSMVVEAHITYSCVLIAQ